MADPITVDILHTLGRAQARELIDKGVHQIASIVPGSVVRASHWNGDTFSFTVEGLGQTIASKIEVFDDHVHATVALPDLLHLAAKQILARLTATGQNLLR